jgi:hypothetical protein
MTSGMLPSGKVEAASTAAVKLLSSIVATGTISSTADLQTMQRVIDLGRLASAVSRANRSPDDTMLVDLDDFTLIADHYEY